MPTLLLSKSDVKKYMDQKKLLKLLKSGFISQSDKNYNNKISYPLNDKKDSVIVLFPGLLHEIPAYSVKIHAKTPNYSPSIKGTINLHDIETGKLMAIMDSTYITAIRTGLSGALGTHLVANPNFNKVTIIGAGVQGEMQLKSLLFFRKITKLTVYDINIEKSKLYAIKIKKEHGIPVIVANSLEEALYNTEIVISATWSKKPFLYKSMLKPGTHITSLGCDEVGKFEIATDIIKESLFICDSKNLVMAMGTIGNLGLDSKYINSEIGEIILNPIKHPVEQYQYTIYSSVGMAFQDLAGAWVVFENAKNDQENTYFDFLC